MFKNYSDQGSEESILKLDTYVMAMLTLRLLYLAKMDRADRFLKDVYVYLCIRKPNTGFTKLLSFIARSISPKIIGKIF